MNIAVHVSVEHVPFGQTLAPANLWILLPQALFFQGLVSHVSPWQRKKVVIVIKFDQRAPSYSDIGPSNYKIHAPSFISLTTSLHLLFPAHQGMRRTALWAAVLVPLVTAEAACWVGMTLGFGVL